MAAIPHFDYPFRLAATGHAVVNEQGGAQDVQAGVALALLCPSGYRVDEPDFGARPDEMSVLPLDLDALTRAIELSEPRALVAIAERRDLIGLLESHLRIYVDRAEGA